MTSLFSALALSAALQFAPAQQAETPAMQPSKPALSFVEAMRSTNAGVCCKVCSTGKACGDSCIARSKSCHKAPGCACDE